MCRQRATGALIMQRAADEYTTASAQSAPSSCAGNDSKIRLFPLLLLPFRFLRDNKQADYKPPIIRRCSRGQICLRTFSPSLLSALFERLSPRSERCENSS